jgi:hypothetical protein
VSELGANLANLAPTPVAPAPQIIYQVVSQPAPQAPAVEPAYQLDTAPPPAPVQLAPQAQPAATPVPAIQLVYSTLAPMEQNSVTANWAAEQYRQEHP